MQAGDRYTNGPMFRRDAGARPPVLRIVFGAVAVMLVTATFLPVKILKILGFIVVAIVALTIFGKVQAEGGGQRAGRHPRRPRRRGEHKGPGLEPGRISCSRGMTRTTRA